MKYIKKFHFLQYIGRFFDNFLVWQGPNCAMTQGGVNATWISVWSTNKISGDTIYFNNILIKWCSTINAHGFHVCKHMIMVPNRSTKDDGVVRKKVPIWLAHIFHVAGWKVREAFTCKRHAAVRVGRGLGHSQGLTKGCAMRCWTYSSVTMSLSTSVDWTKLTGSQPSH